MSRRRIRRERRMRSTPLPRRSRSRLASERRSYRTFMSKPRVVFHIDDSHFACVVKRPVAILMVTFAVGVFGWVSYQRLALTLMPNMSYPTLTVRTTYPGTAPEEIENVISRPLEQQLGITPKLVSISS